MPARKDKPDSTAAGEKSAKLKISAVAELAGVSKQTVEYYILLGLIRPEVNPKTHRRKFDASHVKRIKLIKRLNESGYTLQAIRELWLRKR